jgi:Tol biopolymer transport system component
MVTKKVRKMNHMTKTKIRFLFASIMLASLSANAQVDYSVVSVNEESGTDFTRITSDNDYVCMPIVKRRGAKVDWLSNKIIDVSIDGTQLAYLSVRNKTTNIFIKDVDKQGSSVQRTNRQSVLDFNYSPDGKYICFSEGNGNFNQIFQTSATTGYICRQITSNNKDYSPIYSKDMKNIFFARQESNGTSIWSYNIANNFLSNYTKGMNPYPMTGNSMLCTRSNAQGRSEIWRVNLESGIEECVVSDPNRSFTTPSLSPDGQWILMVGSNTLMNGTRPYANTDIFVCRNDGTQLMQLTYHAADDLSPTWGRNGNYIYFISQRGSATGVANVWRMSFVH